MSEVPDIGGLLTIYDAKHRMLLDATAFSSAGKADDFASDYFATHANAVLALYAPHQYQLRERKQ